jgi:AraC-like DNA-binding protein
MSRRAVRAVAEPTTVIGSIVPKGMVRVGTLMAALPVMREFGIDVEHLLAEFGLQESYLKDPDNTIPYAIMALLLRRCSELTNCPHFALIMGRQLNASAIGTVGFLALSAPDVRTALALLSRYFRLHNPNATVDVVEERGFATLRFTLLQPRLEGREQILDGAIATAFNTLRKLCGPKWEATEVRLARARPRDLTPYRDFFRTTVRFDADESAVVFSSRWLDTPPATADPHLHHSMMKRIRELESSSVEDLASQVRRMLPPLIAARTASVEVVANLVGLAARTLNRRLAAEGTTYVRLREEARHAVACQLLESTGMPANEISDRLGYSNPSAFTRAFERWAGKGPADWRASRQRTTHKPSRRAARD